MLNNKNDLFHASLPSLQNVDKLIGTKIYY